MICIPKSEFQERLVRIQAEMEREKLDAIAVYGDEYRKENLRYVCNFWPIFERAVCVIPKTGKPILAGAPEGENYAREMSVWEEYVNVKEFACVSVPEEIDYPLAKFTKLADVIGGALKGGKKLGIVGWFDIPAPIFERGICVIPKSGEPTLAGAPEGENYAREMSVWSDYRNVKEFACVSVPEEIDYPLATFSTLKDILGAALKGG